MQEEGAEVGNEWRWVRWIMLLLGAAVVALAVHRADVASFTHDESLSYLRFPHQSFGDILRHKEAYTNNHLLNTMGMKYSELLFGTSELALRLPNLLALVLFLIYGALLLRPLPLVLAIGGFVLLSTNSYLLELFTLARGYGLSFGFFLMAQFHLSRAVSSGRAWHVIWFHLGSMLAALSNFTLLTGYVAGVLVYYALILAVPTTDAVPSTRRRMANLCHVPMLVLSLLLLWEPVRKVTIDNVFDFGGKSGFFDNTVATWIKAAVPGFGVSPSIAWIVGSVLALLFFVPFGSIVWALVRRNTVFFGKRMNMVVITLTLLATCIGAGLQHLLLHVDHLEGRFAMFLYPLFLLLLPQLLSLLHKRAYRPVAPVLMFGIALWSVPTFLLHFGPYESVEWGYDVRTKDAITALAADHAAHGSAPPVRIGNSWLLEPTINFYRRTWELDWLELADREKFSADDQYRLVVRWNEPAGYDEGFGVVKDFPESGTVLLRRASMH